MNNVLLMETPDNMRNCINPSYISKKLIAKAFPFTCTLNKPSYVNEFNRCWNNLLWFYNLGYLLKPFIGNFNNPDVRLNGTKWIVCRLCILCFVRALKVVDFPTFGFPTNAIVSILFL